MTSLVSPVEFSLSEYIVETVTFVVQFNAGLKFTKCICKSVINISTNIYQYAVNFRGCIEWVLWN